MTIKRQCELLTVNRSSFYQKKEREMKPKELHGETEENLEIMNRIDKIHLKFPSWGYRKITDYLRLTTGDVINKKRVRRLMKHMGIITIHPGLNLSKRYHSKYIKPYLLRGLNITHVDHVWGIDITYLPLKKGFLYLFIILDWYSRQIVDYEISYSLEKTFVMNCLKRALKHRQPEIINSDQGSHFTSKDYLKIFEDTKIKVSMDGQGQAIDNIRTERFFRSIKYDDIYIKEYLTPKDMIKGVNEYMAIYNSTRPHAALGGITPNMVSTKCPTYLIDQIKGGFQINFKFVS